MQIQSTVKSRRDFRPPLQPRLARKALAAGGAALAEAALGPVGTGLCLGVEVLLMLPSPDFHQFQAFGKQRTLIHLQDLKDNPELAEQVRDRLRALPEVERIRVSSQRGSVCLDGPVTREQLFHTMEVNGWKLSPFKPPAANALASVVMRELGGQVLEGALEPVVGALGASLIRQAVL